MSSLQLPENVLDLKDYELGALILGLFIAAQAEDVGLPADEIPEEFGALVIEHILGLEASSAKLAALEKALHKAASGDFESAGKLFREDLNRGATELKFVPIGIDKTRQASAFVQVGATSSAEKGAANRRAVFDSAKRILANRGRKMSDRQLANLIADQPAIRTAGIKESTVRGHLTALRKEGKLD